MGKIFVFYCLIGFVYFFLPSKVDASTVYGGTFTNGLVVTENGAIVENADITNLSGGVCLKITGDNVVVRNTKIHDCKDHGVQFLGTNGGLIENSEIYRAAMLYKPNSVGSGWPSLMKVQSVDETPSGISQNITIRNNYIHEGYGECMGLRGSYITVSGNHVKDCYSIGIYSNSDHTIVEKNFVECSGNPIYNRSGSPMAGIDFAEESFSNWGAHGHDTQTVINNIVVGCTHGVSYGGSVNSKGLFNSIIAFNTIYKTVKAAIYITYNSGQSGLIIENNIASLVTANTQGASISGNISYNFPAWNIPNDFILTSPLIAQGGYSITNDYFGKTRALPIDAGAIDYGGTNPGKSPSPSPTVKIGDVNGDGKINIIDIGIVIDNYAKPPVNSPNSDVNRDGVINIIDIGLVIDNYGL